MATYTLTIDDETIEIRALLNEAIRWAELILDAGEIGVLTGPAFRKELTG